MSKIGHNNPPKDRKINWKSISINPYDYEDLQKYAVNLRQKKNCFRLLNGEKPLKFVSIPYAISVLITEQLHFKRILETQDNGRNIWEQTAKQLLRTYNSKKGLKKNAKK
tara:strand:- start:1623 stop:1952 length:330 start_codon:yes stop_codon:yes gene_type:complete